MFGDLSEEEINKYSDPKEIAESVSFSTEGRFGRREIFRVLHEINEVSGVYAIKYRVTSKKKGSFIFSSFKEAAEEYNRL